MLSHAELKPDHERPDVPSDRRGSRTAPSFEDAEIVAAAGYADRVAKPLSDIEGALVLADGLAVIPARGLVMRVLPGRLGIVPLVLGDHAGLMGSCRRCQPRCRTAR